MANFLKPPGIDRKGYDASLNKQLVTVTKWSTVGLKGTGPSGERLTVSSNSPLVVRLEERSKQGDLRIFRVHGKQTGHSMIEARAAKGEVVAYMQIEVIPSAGKLIVVNLESQTLRAFAGSVLVFKFDCVSGDSDHPTDRGRFKLLRRVHPYRSKTYDVQMDYALFFTHDGKAIHQYHGPMHFGTMRALKANVSDWWGSHGCVRLQEADARALYNWADSNTFIEVI